MTRNDISLRREGSHWLLTGGSATDLYPTFVRLEDDGPYADLTLADVWDRAGGTILGAVAIDILPSGDSHYLDRHGRIVSIDEMTPPTDPRAPRDRHA